MKLSPLSIVLVGLSLYVLTTHSVQAQGVYGYTSINYNTSTGYVSVTSTTELDYTTQDYYEPEIYSTLRDENGTLLASTSADAYPGMPFVTVTYGTYNTTADEFKAMGSHTARPVLYAYQYGQYAYWDYYNLLWLYDFFHNWHLSNYFIGPGPPRQTNSSMPLHVGETHSYAHRSVVRVTLTLKISGTIVPPPENEDYHSEVAAAGGTDELGPLPMGQGRSEAPGQAYTAPIMVIGQVSPSFAYSATLRWTRLITRRSWYIRWDGANKIWLVTQRSRRGTVTPDIDTGDPAFNDPTPSSTGKIYIYDNSALGPALFNGSALAVGDYIREEKAFIYLVDYWDGARWVPAGRMEVGQVIIVRRQAATGVVSNDWLGVENSNANRILDAQIMTNEVRSMVGGSASIYIDAGANQ